MNKLNDKAIAEAAYYIWKNNGCPAIRTHRTGRSHQTAFGRS